MYYCIHDENEEHCRFEDFCTTLFEKPDVKRTLSERDKKRLILVLTVPTKTRFNPYQYFIEKVQKSIQMCGLNKTGKTFCHAFFYFLETIVIL